MTTLAAFKKEMKEFYKYAVDAQEGETFATWFNDYIETLKDENKVIKKGKTTYILD